MIIMQGERKEMAIMRATMRPTLTRQMMRMTQLGKHELMIRRTANQNAHVITPHGKIQAGRKGRRG
jgi:hypothetical protein